MPKHGAHLWREHPAVRTGAQLTTGERAADRLKATFGSWTFLMCLNGFIVAWIAANLLLGRPFDPFPFILLNLGLSWLAAQQGGALQIAANRGDRISAEIALSTHAMATDLLGLNRQQIEILQRLDGLDGKVADLAQAVQVVMASRAEIAAAERAEVEACRRAAEQTLTEVTAARRSAEAAFVGVQALAAAATGTDPAPVPPAAPAAGMGSRAPAKPRVKGTADGEGTRL